MTHVSPPGIAVRIAGAAAGFGLALSAALHGVWLYAPWPLATWAEWSRAFGSTDFRVPAQIMVAVALLFAAAAYLVAARAGLIRQVGPAWIYGVGVWVIAAVLLLRSAIGFLEMSRTLDNPATPPSFRETILLYLRIYLPIFGVLGALSAYVALGTDRSRYRTSSASPGSDACSAAPARTSDVSDTH
jgi:hypothetical protein